jgi:ABC-type glycerol-3-phosphate transport system substrate-binding protein
LEHFLGGRSICSFVELLLTQNNNFFNSKFKFTSQESEKSLQLLVDLVNKHKISPKAVINYREKDAYNDFVKNDGLFVRGWQSFQKDFKNLDKTSKKEKFISYTQLPHLDGFNIGTTIGGWSLMLSQSSQHKEEAVKFMKYAMSVEAQKIMYTDGSYLPVIKSIYNDSAFKAQNPSIVFAQEILANGMLRPKLEDYTQISNILSKNIRLAIGGSISVKQALTLADKEIQKARQNK